MSSFGEAINRDVLGENWNKPKKSKRSGMKKVKPKHRHRYSYESAIWKHGYWDEIKTCKCGAKRL